MDLREAWTVLGEDPDEVMRELSSMPDVASRVEAARGLLRAAEKVSKSLMRVHHPDLNPGDARSAGRFMRVQSALELIREKTRDLERKASLPPEEKEGVRIVFK